MINNPKIRFNTFSDKWKTIKLGKVFKQKINYVNPKLQNIELWSLTVEKGLTPKTERYNRSFLVKKENQFKAVSDGEFIYNPMNITLGAIDLNKTGIQVAVSGYYVTMKIMNDFDKNYFNVWLKLPLAINLYKSYATGSLIEKQRVQFPTFSLVSATVPEIDEQKKIGSFFKELDDTIALHQQELDALKQTKQGFLQKMFPKDGESIPEIRFSEFTNDWTYNKLGEISKVTLGQSPNGQNYTDNPDDYILVQGNADIKKGRVHPRVWTTQVTKIANPGDIILCVRAPVGDVAKTGHEVVLGRGVASIEGNEFLYHLLYKMKEGGYWARYSTGSTFESINSTDIKEAVVMLPSEEEQIKIGEFFRQVDEFLDLKEQELEALKQTKKGFLQKMFV